MIDVYISHTLCSSFAYLVGSWVTNPHIVDIPIKDTFVGVGPCHMGLMNHPHKMDRAHALSTKLRARAGMAAKHPRATSSFSIKVPTPANLSLDR